MLATSTGLSSTKARITRTEGTDELTLSFSGTQAKFQFIGLDEIKFSDGVTWDLQTIQATYLKQASTNGNDSILGFDSADVMAGGLGDDTLTGGGRADTFCYGVGDGFDQVTDFQHGIDKLKLIATPDAYTLVENVTTRQVLVDFSNGQGVLVNNVNQAQLLGDIVLASI